MFKTQDTLSYFQMALVTRYLFFTFVYDNIHSYNYSYMMSLIYLNVPIFPVAYHFAVWKKKLSWVFKSLSFPYLV